MEAIQDLLQIQIYSSNQSNSQLVIFCFSVSYKVRRLAPREIAFSLSAKFKRHSADWAALRFQKYGIWPWSIHSVNNQGHDRVTSAIRPVFTASLEVSLCFPLLSNREAKLVFHRHSGSDPPLGKSRAYFLLVNFWSQRILVCFQSRPLPRIFKLMREHRNHANRFHLFRLSYPSFLLHVQHGLFPCFF